MAASVGQIRALLTKKLLCQRNCSLCLRSQFSSSSAIDVSDPSKKVLRGQLIIPRKTKRDSLSILKALSSTVDPDPTGTSYVFIDDPELIPSNLNTKKLLLLSKASGQKAARFIINEFRNTFDHDAAAPHVQAFQPDVVEYKFKMVGEDALKERIERREVVHAIEVYDKMKQQEKAVSKETQLLLLELLCVYGMENPSSLLALELMTLNTKQGKPKKNLSKAKEVFHDLGEPNADAYNLLVTGLLKEDDREGLVFYDLMKADNVEVYLGTYNELIRTSGTWTQIEDLMIMMNNSGVTPNKETFHSILHALKIIGLPKAVPSIIAEMKTLAIEPTLQTWSLVLDVLVMEDVKTRKNHQRDGYTCLSDILDIIQHLKEKAQDLDITDTVGESFFTKAMLQCLKSDDSEIALALHELKSSMGANYIVTNLIEEHNYHSYLMIILCKTETLETVMDIYHKLSRVYSPQENVIILLLDTLNIYGQYQYITTIWEDYFWEKPYSPQSVNVVQKFLTLMSKKNLTEKMKMEFALLGQKYLDSLIEDMKKPSLRFKLRASELDLLMQIFLNAGDLQKAWKCLMLATKNECQGYIRHNCLSEMFKALIEWKDISKIMKFCQLPSDILEKSVSDIINEHMSELQTFLQPEHLETLRKYQ